MIISESGIHRFERTTVDRNRFDDQCFPFYLAQIYDLSHVTVPVSETANDPETVALISLPEPPDIYRHMSIMHLPLFLLFVYGCIAIYPAF